MQSVFDGAVIDRRTFFHKVGLTAGAAAAATVLPASALFAAPGNVMTRYMATDTAPDGVWDADSVFGHFPRYDHPVGYGKPRREGIAIAEVDAVDRNFLA